MLTEPLWVFLLTTTGGAMLFLLLLRRPLRDDQGQLQLATAGATAGPPLTAPVAGGPKAALESTSQLGPTRPSDHVPRLFDKPPAKDVERLAIRSRRVRLNATPDDLRSAELGRLDLGDEIELLDSFEGFVQVRTPDGTTGWIRRTALI
jgi:Bacterial SH3 domain